MQRPLLLVAVLLGAGCLQEPGAEPTSPTMTTPTITHAVTPTPSSPTPGDTNIDDADALVAANTRFAMDEFAKLSADAPGENLVVSPYSIATALQMVYGGADGETLAAMTDALRLGDAAPMLDEQAGALLRNLTSSDPNVTLRVGNSLWLDATFGPHVQPAFTQRAQDVFAAEPFARDFREASTVDDVNAWASEATEGKIPTVIEEIANDEVMFLINAVYFKGLWTQPFNASCTHEADFTRDDGVTVTVDMMCGATGGHTYSDTPERTVARLPYGEGRFAMYLVLPPEGTDLDAFVETWDGDLADVRAPELVLQMPRLKLSTRTLDLVPTLTYMGMGVAFTDQADFTRIAESLYLSRVLHDAVMEVDEEGSVAAAVTTIGVGATSYTPPFELTIDRPFLVAIRDDASGTLLFVGKVHEPGAG